MIHYNGLTNHFFILLGWFVPFIGLFVQWQPRSEGDVSMEEEKNPLFGRGCFDREREPHNFGKCFAGCHYAGVPSVPCALTALCSTGFFWCCGVMSWKFEYPTLPGVVLVGEPVPCFSSFDGFVHVNVKPIHSAKALAAAKVFSVAKKVDRLPELVMRDMRAEEK